MKKRNQSLLLHVMVIIHLFCAKVIFLLENPFCFREVQHKRKRDKKKTVALQMNKTPKLWQDKGRPQWYVQTLSCFSILIHTGLHCLDAGPLQRSAMFVRQFIQTWKEVAVWDMGWIPWAKMYFWYFLFWIQGVQNACTSNKMVALFF